LSSVPAGQSDPEACLLKPTGFVRHYEDLRGEVLTGETSRTGSSGLALVVHRGLVEWLRVAAQRLSPVGRREDPPPPRGSEATSTLGSLPSQLTLVLANMILGGQREVTA